MFQLLLIFQSENSRQQSTFGTIRLECFCRRKFSRAAK